MSQKSMNPILFETTYETYTAISIIGEGGVGKIYAVADKDGKKYALKLLDPNKSSKEKLKRFKNEISFCERINHPNIVSIEDRGIFISKEKSLPFYVMPLYSKSLKNILDEKIPHEKILKYFSQILNGVEAAHLKKVIHRDLKPQNILYDPANDKLLIADFGIARFPEDEMESLVETKTSTRLANFIYHAPEQRTGGKTTSYASDIYALGLILNEMFTGEVIQGSEFKTILSVSSQYGYLDEIISVMIRQSASDRPQSIEEIKKLLIGKQNQFIISQKISALENEKVIPITETDDPLIADPIRLTDFDWNNGNLMLQLNRPINENWKWALYNMGGTVTFLYGKEPRAFHLERDKAYI